ncbi:MAG: hypothetical protein JW940_00755 [Polyangiaceae bacterium]|nr:hypothetical protein [Polyangiaceae bacterium]
MARKRKVGEAPPTTRSWWTDRQLLVLFGSVAFLYLYFFPYFDRLNSPAENARIYMVKAIVEHHTFSVDAVIQGLYASNADLSQYDGRLYSCKAPGTSFLGVPVLYAFTRLGSLSKLGETYVLRLFVSTLPSLVFLFVYYGFLRRFSEHRYLRNLTFLGLALGTMFFTYALLLFGHQQAAIGLFGGFMCCYENKRRERDSVVLLLAGGLLIALGVSCEYQAVLAGLCLAAYAFVSTKRKWRFVIVLAGGLGPAVLTGLYHQQSFGSVLHTGHDYLASQAFVDYQQYGYKGFFYFTCSSLSGTFWSPGNGLFFYAPWLLFLVPGVYAMFHKKGFFWEALCISLVVLSDFVFVSGMYAWKGGWSVGPRYLGVTMPFIALTILVFLDWVSQRFRHLYYVFVPALVVSVLIYALSSVIYPHFPDSIHNPYFELLLPLLSMGYYPYNLGRLLGLGDFPSALPYFAVLLPLLGYIVVGYVGETALVPRMRSAVANCAVVLAITACVLQAMSLPKTAQPAAVAGGLSLAKQVWEPPQRAPL